MRDAGGPNRKLVLACLAVVLAATMPFRSNAQSARQLAQNTFPSVVMQDASGQPVSLGSGFFVARGIIATNLHVVRGASSGQAKLVGRAQTYTVNSLVAIDPAEDLVLLNVPGANAPQLRLGDSSQVAVGDPVYAVGNPEGLEGTFSEGIVSGIRSDASQRLLQITAPISPGSSGGPILNSRGEVVGVTVATFTEGQNLNFAIPSSYVASLLEHVGEPHPLSSEMEISAGARSLSGAIGGKSTDGVTRGQFSWDSGEVGSFSFSLHNQLQRPVRDVHFLIVFLKRADDGIETPVDYLEGKTCGDLIILPRLAKRIERTINFDSTSRTLKGCVRLWETPSVMEIMEKARVDRAEIRVLNFKFAE